jgi:hypothetical protein
MLTHIFSFPLGSGAKPGRFFWPSSSLSVLSGFSQCPQLLRLLLVLNFPKDFLRASVSPWWILFFGVAPLHDVRD